MRAAILLFTFLCLPTWAKGQPSMSPVIPIDHGFRFPYDENNGGRCQVVPTPGGYLFAYSGGSRLRLYRRGPNLEEQDRLAVRPQSGGSELLMSAYRIAALAPGELTLLFDARTYGNFWRKSSITIQHLDVESLDPVGEPILLKADTENGGSPELTANSAVILVGWVENDRAIHLKRLDRSTFEVDPQEDSITGGARRTPFVFDLSDDGGWLIGVDEVEDRYLLRLDAEGRPSGDRIPIRGLGQRDFALTRVGPRWLAVFAAWEGVRCLWLDSQGPVGDSFLLPESEYHSSGLAVAASKSTVAIAHRVHSDPSELRVNLVRAGEAASFAGFSLADSALVDYEADGNRTMDLAWDRETFVAIWSDTYSLCTGSASGPCEYPDAPVRTRRFTESGELLETSPISVNIATKINWSALSYHDGVLRATLFDNFDPAGRQAIKLDNSGALIGTASRHATLHPQGNSHLIPGGMRPWRGDQALLYQTRGWYDYEYYYWSWSAIGVARLDENGFATQFVQVQVDGREGFPDVAHQFDMVDLDSSLFVAYDKGFGYRRNEPPVVHVESRDAAGAFIHRWIARADSGSAYPTLAPGDNGALVVWADHDGARWQLRRRLLPAGREGDSLHGLPLLPEVGHQTAPWLIDGPEGLLCVYRYWDPTSPTDSDIHAVRLARDGTPLDRWPLVLCASAGHQGQLNGVWDGLHWVVFWSDLYPLPAALYANRVRADGRVMDGSGFHVMDGYYAQSVPAANGAGRVAILCGDQLRFLDDAIVPTLPTAPSLDAQSDGIRISIDLSSEFGAADIAVYRRRLSSPSDVAVPPEGFDRLAAGVEEDLPGAFHAFDTEVAPGAWYAYAIGLGDGALWSQVATIQASEWTQLVVGASPNPWREVGVITLRVPQDAREATIDIVTPSGRRVHQLRLSPALRGHQRIPWDGRLGDGTVAPTGVYFLRAHAGSFRDTARVVLIH